MVACAEVHTFNKRSTANPQNKTRPNLKHISEKTDSVNPSTSMEIRPCFSSVWRRRLKFSTLPSAVNLDGNKDGDTFLLRFPGSFQLGSPVSTFMLHNLVGSLCALSRTHWFSLATSMMTKTPCGIPETDRILNAQLILKGPQWRGRVVGPVLR